MEIINLFRELVDKSDSEIAYGFLLAHPVLMWDRHWDDIQRWIRSMPVNDQPNIQQKFNVIRDVSILIEKEPSSFPENIGPLEKILNQYEASEISLSNAQKKASEAASILYPLYIRICAARAAHMANIREWRRSVAFFRIIFAALDKWVELENNKNVKIDTVARWIYTATIACNDVPDARVFNSAIERGIDCVKQAEANGNSELAAVLNHRLGVLYLDSYFGGRNPNRIDTQLKIWLARCMEEFGTAYSVHKDSEMPTPHEALSKAMYHFERSLDLNSDNDESRGLSLKALAQTLYWQKIIGENIDGDYLINVVKEALSLLDPNEHSVHVATLRKLLQADTNNGKEENYQNEIIVDEDLLWLYPEGLSDKNFDSNVVLKYFDLADHYSFSGKPAIALSLLRMIIPIVEKFGNEDLLIDLATQTLSVLSVRFGAKSLINEHGGNIEKALETMHELSKVECWSRTKKAFALLAIVGAAISLDKEDSVLDVIKQAVEILESSNSDFLEISRIIHVNIAIGAAVNAVNSHDLRRATEYYAKALDLCTKTRLNQMVKEILDRAEDIALKGDIDVYAPYLITLANAGPNIATKNGAGIGYHLNYAWQKLLGHMLNKLPISVEALWLAFNAAKGGTFATMLHQKNNYNWRHDPEVTNMLARIKEIRVSGALETINNAEALREDDVLVSYITKAQTHGGNSPAEILANLERRMDDYLASSFISNSSPLEAYLNLEETQKLLGPRTVLLNQYIGQTHDGRVLYTCLLVTNDDIKIYTGISDLPSGIIVLQDQSGECLMNWISLGVADLRSHLLEEPGPSDLVPEASKILERQFKQFFSDELMQRLTLLKAEGRNHLCFHSHGPLNYHPLHLLGPEGNPLANDWIVTMLPHTSMLRRLGVVVESDGRVPIASFGIDFSEKKPHSLLPIPGAIEEAKLVSKSFNGSVYIDDDATETRFLEALTGATRVHLSTHGRHNVSAPSFQCVYLYPDHLSDGIFYAYEALALNLQNLDIITLSACETSLGRMDIGDSPRGLPASLFISGARTIIGCMWPVATNVASIFFSTFYSALANRGCKLDAFREAQIATREKFPAYRDWGAFQYSGLW